MAIVDIGAEANALHAQLAEDFVLPLPDIDLSGPEFDFPFDATSPLYQAIPRLTTCDLTSGEPDGTGVFDSLMSSISAHLKVEFEQNRISGGDYTKAYIAAMETALGNATQFLLQRDQAYWQAQQAQLAAITARVQLQTAKAQMVQTMYGAMREKAGYTLTKMQTLVSSLEAKAADFNLSNMLPVQKEILDKQSAAATLQNEGLTLDNSTKDFQLTNILPQQNMLLVEQTETARAQTLDHRTDGALIVGSVGKQKDLLSQQITSYQRKSEMDAAKLFSDAWTVQKTVDEGLVPPTNFTNANVDAVLSKVRVNNGLA